MIYTGLDLTQAKQLIVMPVLSDMGRAVAAMNSPSAINLVTGTIAAESGGIYLAQLDGGPARSFWQMEGEDHDDIWKNWLPYNANINAVLNTYLGMTGPKVDVMVWNLKYACGMVRIAYRRAPPALPAFDDAGALAAYHVAWYNRGGKADVATNTPLFQLAIDA